MILLQKTKPRAALLALLCGTAASQISKIPSPPTGHITAGRDMITARSGLTATTLPDFKVLIAGGKDQKGIVLSSTEIYDPNTETFSPGHKMSIARQGHIAAILGDSNILIAGGATHGGAALASSEMYDYESRKFVPRGNMHVPRVHATATVLRDGRVLVIGGENGKQILDSAETYNLLDGKWTLTGKMSSPRAGHTATLLSDGRVLILGGRNRNSVLASAEVFDPKTNHFSPATEMHEPRFLHTAALLPNGKVLIVGGASDPGATKAQASSEIYEPDSQTSTESGKLNEPRMNLADAQLLLDGRVLITGGSSTAEIYEPRLGTFRLVNGSFAGPLLSPAAIELMDGSIRIFGGADANGTSSAKSWIYRP